MSRKITETSIARWLNGKTFSDGNTSSDGTTLFLHDNAIARHTSDHGIEISTAGWPTTTTKERLNGIPGVQVYHSKGVLYLHDEPWGGEWKLLEGPGVASRCIRFHRTEKCDPRCAAYFRNAETGCVERCDDCARLNHYERIVCDEDIAVAISTGLLPEAE